VAGPGRCKISHFYNPTTSQTEIDDVPRFGFSSGCVSAVSDPSAASAVQSLFSPKSEPHPNPSTAIAKSVKIQGCILSSSESFPERIEGCGLAQIRRLSRTPFDRLRMQLRYELVPRSTQAAVAWDFTMPCCLLNSPLLPGARRDTMETIDSQYLLDH